MVAPDGLFWAKAPDVDVLIVDEDSGKDFGFTRCNRLLPGSSWCGKILELWQALLLIQVILKKLELRAA